MEGSNYLCSSISEGAMVDCDWRRKGQSNRSMIFEPAVVVIEIFVILFFLWRPFKHTITIDLINYDLECLFNQSDLVEK